MYITVYNAVKQYIYSFATAVSEALASDFVLNLVWDSRRLGFPGFVLAFSTAFLEGRAGRVPTGVFSRARVPESRATDERGAPELEGSSLGRGDTEVLFFSVLEICVAVVAQRRVFFFVTDSILIFSCSL